MNPTRPRPILAIEILGYVGVAFWATTIVRTAFSDSGSLLGVLVVGLILGAAHVVISRGAARRSRIVYAAMWFVLVSDTLLTFFVDVRALVLVGFTIVLLLLTRLPSARDWLAPTR